MIYIFGGSYQGKLDYTKERFNLTDKDIYTCEVRPDLQGSQEKRCIYHFENYVKACCENGLDPLCEFSKDKIIIMEDINCGVVPTDPAMRAWREAVGRAGAALSENADEVVRIFCGLPQILKVKTTKIYMVRHGKTQANLDYVYCGMTDLPLTEIGAKELKENRAHTNYPKEEGLKFYTSQLKRTKESLAVLYPGVTATEIPGLNEIDFGDFEMRKYDKDLQADPDFITWTSGDNDSNVCPHGESYRILRRRSLAALDELLEKGEDCFILDHGGPITAIFQHYIPESGLNYYEIQPKNGEGYCFEFEGKRFVRYTKICRQE